MPRRRSEVLYMWICRRKTTQWMRSSVKAASDLISPVSGTVREVNTALEDSPALLNTAPYENWIIKVEMSDPSQLDNLMSAADYAAYCETL